MEVQRDGSWSAEWTWTLETHKEAEFCLETEVLEDYEIINKVSSGGGADDLG